MEEDERELKWIWGKGNEEKVREEIEGIRERMNKKEKI